jgi:hypothetical protein
MAEKYIVIDTYYKDRFIAVEYLGETQKFIKIKEKYGAQIKRSKDSVIIVSTHDTMEGAQKVADKITAKLKGAKRHYDQRVSEIIASAQQGVSNSKGEECGD